MFLGKDNFVTKHQGKDGSRRTKRGEPICRFCFVLFCFFFGGGRGRGVAFVVALELFC